MADNITFQTTPATPAAGTVAATDDVGGVHFQKVKIDVGGDGVSTILSTSNPLPVAQQGTVTVSGTVTANLSASTYAGMTALTADYDSGGGTQNMPLMGVALPGSGGGVAGGTFTNPFRTDPTGTTAQPVTDNGGSLTVDGSVTIGAALPAGNNNIGDVDVATIAAGDNLIGRVKVSDGTTVATVSNYTNSKPLNVRLTNADGDYEPVGVSANIAHNQVSVGATATLICAARTARKAITVVQHGSTLLYLGNSSGVTTSNGAALVGIPGAAVTLNYRGDVYGITSSGSNTVSYVEEY